jgi:hypothetical protein
MTWYLLGCDPDTQGALAVISGPSVGLASTIQVLDCPFEKHATRRVVSVEKMVERVRDLVRDLGIPTGTVVHFEDGGTRPGLSSISALVFGRVMGAWHAALVSCGLEVRKVTPVAWKNELKLTSDKRESVRMAWDLFRDAKGAEEVLKKQNRRQERSLDANAHGRAEALLIAAYGHRIAQRDAGRSDILTDAVHDAIAARPEKTKKKRKRRDVPNVPDASDGAGPAEAPAADDAEQLDADLAFTRAQRSDDPAVFAQLLVQQGARDVIFVKETNNGE